MTIIQITVTTMEKVGVPVFPTLLKRLLMRRSRDIAKGYLEADIIPALPVDANAATAATTTAIIPPEPGSHDKNLAPASATGVRLA